MRARVLVVDDERTAREELCEALRDAGFKVSSAASAEQALEQASRRSFDLCISDIRMPGLDGIELLRRLGELAPETLVILVTAYGDLKTAIAALRQGATDYILKPLLFEDIVSRVRRLIDHRDLALEVRDLRRQLRTASRGTPIVGKSAAMSRVKSLIAKVAGSRNSLLILGDNGTGKELIARAIHEAGHSADLPFVPVNCATRPQLLLESDLFGHIRGAFSGAVEGREGLLQTAGEGSVFLDEVADLPPAVQAKLLRVIESREIQPLGSARRIAVRARMMAATCRDMKAEIAAGRFRQDLYERLAVVEIAVPSLAARREDIPLLLDHFVTKHNRQLSRDFSGIARDALELLVGYHWPGNMRQLEKVVERAMIIGGGSQISTRDLPEEVQAADPVDPSTLMPERIGPYRVAGRLGGGMSDVYRGYDERLDRPVVIKLIPADEASAAAHERLHREARAVAKLNHRSIVRIYHFLELDQNDCIVMEFVEGEPLVKALQGGPLPMATVLTLGRDIAAGLAEAHAHGIVHRDLKTENVIITPRGRASAGRAKILDFGLAKPFRDLEPSITEAGHVFGTCRAMSPEQASGLDVDHRSDLFSFGTLLYEMATGESPFLRSSRMATLTQVCAHVPPPVIELEPRAPRELSDLIERLLEKRPEKRPQHASEVKRVLDRLAGVPPARVERGPGEPGNDAGGGIPSEVSATVEVVRELGSAVTEVAARASLWRRFLRLFSSA